MELFEQNHSFFLTAKLDFAKLAIPAEQLFLQTIPTVLSERHGITSWHLLDCMQSIRSNQLGNYWVLLN